MNYKKSILYAALSLGLSITVTAQSPKFSLNGLGRSIIANNNLGGNFTQENEGIQTRDISGYNLFDLQSNLDLDSTFYAKAVFRTRSPFGTSFGSQTTFEFRQFKMGGKVGGLKYEFGDIRLELTPFTLFNSDIASTGYESEIFKGRRDIVEYENFNVGNTWLLQGASSQYSWNIGKASELGIYAFTTRTVSTNSLETVPDRLLSGGRMQYAFNSNVKLGVNSVSLYDLVTNSSDFDYNNNVVTGDLKYNRKLGTGEFSMNLEAGGSFYSYDDNVNEVDTSYKDLTMALDLAYKLKSGLKFGVDVKRVGAVFASPTAQTRRFNPLMAPSLFGKDRTSQVYYDQFINEDIYNSGIDINLMTYANIFNNINPYGAATPNRFVVGATFATDTSVTDYGANVRFDYGSEIIGEGGDPKRTFIVVTAGGVLHLSNLLNVDRLIDLNAGVRYENTSRSEGAIVDLTSMLVDFGASVEVVKKLDLQVGLKYFAAIGNEFVTQRDGFNLVSGFQELDVDVSEVVFSGGIRIRFSKKQSFSLNYNNMQFSDNLTSTESLNLGQLFFGYVGKF